MSKPRWIRYTGEDFDVGNAVKIREHSGKTVVLLARSEVECDNRNLSLFGDFVLGEACATVCTVDRVFQVEDFEVLLAPEGYFQWVECLYGYVPKFAVCAGSSVLDHVPNLLRESMTRAVLEPCFAGRVWQSDDIRGGSILPSRSKCFVPPRNSSTASDVEATDDKANKKTQVYANYTYDVLQVAPNQRTDNNVPAGFVIARMGEDKVLAELAQLFQQHFHGRSQVKFHDAISQLWVRSGLDADFFFPQALPWLLGLAQVHGLPNCFRQCLLRSLETRKLTTEKQLCEGIKLARLFKHCTMNGSHEQTGQTERRRGGVIEPWELRPREFELDPLKREWDERGNTKQRMLAVFIQTVLAHPNAPPVDAYKTAEKKILSNHERQVENMKRKSLLPPSRPLVAHSVMVQRQEEYTDVGIQLDIEDDQMMLELEVPPPLSQSQMGHYDEQVQHYLETTDCTAQIAAVMETLVAACQRQQKMMIETNQTNVKTQLEEDQLLRTQGKLTSLHKIFSTLLTSDVSYTSDLMKSLCPLLDQYVANEWGGTLTPKEISDLVVSNELKPQVVPNELKTLLAKSFILSLYNRSEDAAVFSKVEDRVFDFLVAHVTSNNGDNNLLLPLTWILTHSPTSPDQLGPGIFSTLIEFLKNMADDQFLRDDSTVVPILKLLRDKCKTYSTHVIEIMRKYLGSGSNQSGRIYSVQWLKLAAMETDTHLDEETLTTLRNLMNDSNPCIKYNARAAFATEINKQTDQWTAETFPYAGILTEIIATEPIILTLAGEKPQYFTHSINTPILRILNYYRIQQRKSQWKVTKCVGKLFGKDAKPQETLSPGWEVTLKEGLKYLSNQAQAIPKSVFEAVDKVFVEQDNCSILPDCARFISECANKRQMDSEYVTMSSQFLEQLCRRLRLSPSETHRRRYFECLHTLRVWQELPDDIFRMYHTEAGAARLLSVIDDEKKNKLAEKLAMNVPVNQVADVSKDIVTWIEIYLRRGFFLTPGIIEAYSKSKVTTESIKAGLTAAANNGQVIPQDILSKALDGFPTLSIDKKGMELARACLRNQSLPDQVLKNVWQYLTETEQVLRSESKEESCLILMCSSVLLNRNLPKSDNHETLISDLYKKFISPEDIKNERLQEIKVLFFLAMQQLERNTQERPAAADRLEEEQQDLREFIEKAVNPILNILWDPESLQRLIVILRSSSAAREFLEQTLSEFDPSDISNEKSTCIKRPALDILPFARATFVSMVTTSTDIVAGECGQILELICNKFGQRDWRLGTVVATVERMQTLRITSFKCVDKLLKKSSVKPLIAKQRMSLFDPRLDDLNYTKKFSKHELKMEPRGSYPTRGDLMGELLVAAYKKVICGKSALSEATVELLLEICMHSACFTYNCPAPVLMQYVERYIIAHSTIFSLPAQMNEGALTDLVYSSVVSSLAATIRQKISGHDSSSTCSHYRESILVLAAELLEAFRNDAPKLNSFLSKLSTVNMDTLWRIAPALYNYSKLDFSRFNIRDDNYEIEIEVEAILAEIFMSPLRDDDSLGHALAGGLKSIIRQGYSFKHFLDCTEVNAAGKIQAALRLAAYNVDPLDLQTVQLVRSAHKYKHNREFLAAINKRIQSVARKRPQMELSLNELIRKLTAVKGNTETLTESNLFSSIREVVDQRDNKQIQLGRCIPRKPVNLLTPEDIKNWSDFVRGNKEIDPVEAICVANRAVKLWRSWDLTIVQISAILLGLSQTNERNLFLELSTGSGKSVVIAVIGAVKALTGNKVDIVTSNHLLAQRDAQEWKEFYSFFNLSCSSNGDGAVSYRKGFKECYTKDIVYGEINQFQFDDLRTEFLGLETRDGRPYDEVIIDEADSILLDEGSKLAMLSTGFTGMDKLEPIYHLIRSKLIHFDSQQTYFSRDGVLYLKHDNNGDTKEGQDLGIPRREHLMQNLKHFIQNLLKESGTATETQETVKIPPHLLEYSKSQVSNWAEAAITAEALEENKDYLVVDNKVVPIDPHNGVLQPSSNWTNGLHQFLQIKHQVDFTPESPTTNYLSNIAMVKKYKHGFIGLTGTLGSRNSHELLSQHFKADCIPVPDLYPSRFTQLQNIIVRTRKEWREIIRTCIEDEVNLNREVLVICETVKQAQGLYSKLSKSMAETRCQVKLYARSDNWMEHHLQQSQPRHVIITTNLGTRGMNIQASAIEAAGGLHVILAYKPPNTRIVRQAFGRTSRKGNVGSGQFIIKQKLGTLEPADVMKHITESETSALQKYFEHELPSITFKDKIYSDFVAKYSLTREGVRKFKLVEEESFKDQAQRIGQKVFSKKEELSGAKFIILEAIQEVWASYLKQILDSSSASDGKISGKTELETLLTSGWINLHELFRNSGNCYHATRYGFQVYRQLKSTKAPKSAFPKNYIDDGFDFADSISGNHKQIAKAAQDYFNLAIEMAPENCAAAHVGMAYVVLKRRKNSRSSRGKLVVNYKVDALHHLRKAIEILGRDIGYYRGCKGLLSIPATSRLAVQLNEKISVLEVYTAVVEDTFDTVRLSLRPVEVTYRRVMDDTIHILWVTDGNVSTAEDLNKDFDVFHTEHEIQLAFHGLKANKDIRFSYQAEDAVKLLYDKLNFSKGTEPTVSLCVDVNGIRKVFGEPIVGLSKSEMNDDEEGADFKHPVQLPSFKVPCDLKPIFTAVFTSIKSWDDVARKASTFTCKGQVPTSKIKLTAAKDVAEDLLSVLSEPPELLRALRHVNICRETFPANNESASKQKWITIDTKVIGRDALNALFDKAMSSNVHVEVVFEDLNLEEDDVRSQVILQNPTKVRIRFPSLSSAAGVEKMAKQIVESIHFYSEMSRKNGVTPTLEFGNLNSSLARKLYEEVNRVSEPMQQITLVPVRDLPFPTVALSPEALRHLEQQGLLLVAKLAEKNAVPKKALALMCSVTAGELLLGGVLCGLGVPAGAALIKSGLQDAWRTFKLTQTHEFSLIEFVVGKTVTLLKMGVDQVTDNTWIDRFFSSLLKATTPNEIETTVMTQWAELTCSDVFQAGFSFAANMFFLYLQFDGQKTIIEAIKKELQKHERELCLENLERNRLEELVVTFHAVVSAGLDEKPKDELTKWLLSLNQEEMWNIDVPDGLKVVDWDWESLEKTEARHEKIGHHLLDAFKKVAMDSTYTYFTLAVTKIVKEFKSHCLKLCMDVLEQCKFEQHAIQCIRNELCEEATSPVSQIMQILEKEIVTFYVEDTRLENVKRKFKDIEDRISQKKSAVHDELYDQIIKYLMSGIESFAVLEHLVEKWVPLTFDTRTKGSIIRVTPSADDAFQPVKNKPDDPHWEDSIIHRLIQKLEETCVSGDIQIEASWSTQLATLIILLYKTKVRAILLPRGLQPLKRIPYGNSKDPGVILYTLASRSSKLEALTFTQEAKSRDFKGPKFVLKAVSCISCCPLADVQSVWDGIMGGTQDRKIYTQLKELCNKVLNNGRKK